MTHQKRARESRPPSRPLAAQAKDLSRDVRAARRPAAEQPIPALAENVRRLRLERGMSLQALAESAGLTEPVLSLIEAGDETPTIPLLWSLANALSVPFSTLVREPSAAQEPLPPRPERLVRRPVVPASKSAAHSTEVYELTLAAGATEDVAAADGLVLESLLVTAGQLVVHHSGQRHALSVGDSVTLPGGVRRLYENPGATAAVAFVKVSPARGA